MFESYVSEKLLTSLKYRGEDDFMARVPASYCPVQPTWLCAMLSRLGDTLIQAGQTLKRRYQVKQPAISAY